MHCNVLSRDNSPGHQCSPLCSFLKIPLMLRLMLHLTCELRQGHHQSVHLGLGGAILSPCSPLCHPTRASSWGPPATLAIDLSRQFRSHLPESFWKPTKWSVQRLSPPPVCKLHKEMACFLTYTSALRHIRSSIFVQLMNIWINK